MPSDRPLHDHRSKRENMIATLNGIRKESVVTSVLLIVIAVVFVWGFGPWPGRHAGGPTRDAEMSVAIRAAGSFGFTDIRITKTLHVGGALSPCDENDNAAHVAVATNPQGRAVSLLICCNSTNNCTIKTR